MTWLSDVLVAKPKWDEHTKPQVYVRGLNEKFPYRWCRLDGTGGFYDECFIKVFAKLDWKFFPTVELAEKYIEVNDG